MFPDADLVSTCHYGEMSSVVEQSIWQVPRVDQERRVITGTAAGVAAELGIDPIYVRVSFVVLTIAGGWGLVLYVLAMAIMRSRSDDRDYEPVPKAASPEIRIVAFTMVAVGLVVLSSLLGLAFLRPLVWPSALVGAGVAIAFDRGGDPKRQLAEISQTDHFGQRVLLGLAFLFAGVVFALSLSLSFWQAMSGIIVAALVLAGAAIVFAPIISRMGADLLAERRRRIRVEERSDMAAHLHDSVLQTLSLIQKRSDDAAVVSLARHQERELRSWLFNDRSLNPNLGFRAELERQMGEVENTYTKPIEVVVVGDRQMTDDIDALLRACREAASNAARHSGASKVDVFAEVTDEQIEVFVRDQGVGFDLGAVETDRAGLRDSVVGRMERHGGSAVVETAPGSGTEVELVLPLDSLTGV